LTNFAWAKNLCDGNSFGRWCQRHFLKSSG
jgi:hypothetical protein